LDGIRANPAPNRGQIDPADARHRKAPYSGMYSNLMFDPDGPGKPAGRRQSERISESMREYLLGFPEGQNMLEAMDRLHEELTAVRAVNRGNIFQINAALSNAYKDFFSAAESIAEAHQRRKDAALEARKPKAPEEDENDYNTGFDNFDEAKDAEYEKYNADMLEFENNRETHLKEIKEQFAADDLTLATLSVQMQKMTANRAFILVTVQDMFDELQSGNTAEFPAASFEEHMKTRTMDVLTAEATADAGAINEVYRTSVGVDELFVKPGSRLIDYDNENAAFQLDSLGLTTDDAKTNESAFRDQGAQIVSKILGVDVVVKSRLAMDNKAGVVSAMNAAPGLRGDKFMVVKTDADAAAMQQRLDTMQQKVKEAKLEERYEVPKAALNLSNKSLQVSAIELGVLDYIIDNDDRHHQNFFIKQEAGAYKIVGIDNDGAFGASNRILNNEEMRELIPFVTPELQTKIRNLNADDMANALRGVVDRGEHGNEVIDTLKGRIQKLKAHVETIPVKTVDELGADTADMLAARSEGERANKPFAWMQRYVSPEAKGDFNNNMNINRKEKNINIDHEHAMHEKAKQG